MTRVPVLSPVGAPAATTPEADGSGGYSWVAASVAGALSKLPIQAAVTASGNAVTNAHNQADATSGTVSLALPAGQILGTLCSVEKTDSSANPVNVTGSIRGIGAQTIGLLLPHESILFEADSSGSWWPFASHKTLSSLDSRYVNLTSADSAIPAHVEINSIKVDISRPHGIYAAVAPNGDATAAIQGVVLDAVGAGLTSVSGAGQTFPNGTLTVASTAGFPSSGQLNVAGVTGNVTYTGKTSTSFTGCTGGTGTATNGGVVISAGIALGSGPGALALTIFASKPGTYTINGPVLTVTSGASNFANAGQILLPGLQGSTGLSLEIVGLGKPIRSSGSTTQPGVTFSSNAAGGEIISALAAGSGIYPDLSMLLLNLERVTFLATTATGGGIDCNALGGLQLHDTVVTNSTGASSRNGVIFPHTTQHGQMIMSGSGVEGFSSGIVMAEHVDFEEWNWVQSCTNAFELPGGGHQVFINHVWVTSCPTILFGRTGASHVIARIAWESGSLTGLGARLVNDSGCFITGTLDLFVPGGMGNTSTASLCATVGNATTPVGHALDIRIHTDSAGWRAKHPKDSFLRVNAPLAGTDAPGYTSDTWHPSRVQTPAAPPAILTGAALGTLVSGAGQTMPTGTVNVKSTLGFPTTGSLQIAGVTGVVAYTGTTATSFTGCTGGTGTATNGGTVFLVAAVNGAGQTMPTGTLTVGSTYGFSPSGTLTVAGVTGAVTYTGITPTTFTGCTGGTGTATNGGSVVQASANTGLLAPTTAATTQVYWPVRDGRYGGRSRALTALITTGSSYSSTGIQMQRMLGGTGSTNVISAVFNSTAQLVLQITGSGNVVTVSGVISANTLYALTLVVIVDETGLPSRARILLNGAVVADHKLTAAERANFAVNGGVAPQHYPYLEDGVQFSSTDVGSYCSGIYVRDVVEEDIEGRQGIVSVTEAAGAGYTPDAQAGTTHKIAVQDNTAFVIDKPTNPPDASLGQLLTVEILNQSGGALTGGNVTFTVAGSNCFLTLGRTLTLPANNKRRFVTFFWNGANWVWWQDSNSYADY